MAIFKRLQEFAFLSPLYLLTLLNQQTIPYRRPMSVKVITAEANSSACYFWAELKMHLIHNQLYAKNDSA